MKKISFITALFVILVACKGQENKDQNNEITSQKNEKVLKRYDVKSGMIEYKSTINGSIMGGKITGSGMQSLYFKNWGAQELKEEQSTQTTKVSVMGHTTEETVSAHTINKLDNGEVFVANFENQTITKMRDPMMDFFKMSDTDAGDAGKKMMESMGGKKLGNENYMGYDCEIWELMGAKQWIYKGVTLKIVAELMGVSTVTEATSVKFDVNVPESKFSLPDFKVVESEGYMSNDEFNQEMKEAKEDMKQFKKLSFEEWKAMIQKEDPEMKQMSDEELKQIYDMMQKMAN